MTDFQLRVLSEKQELDVKLVKLNNFIVSESFLSLSEINKELLKKQANIMLQYSNVLFERITEFSR